MTKQDLRRLIREEISNVSAPLTAATDFVEKLKATGWTKELNSIFKKQFKKPRLAKQLKVKDFPFRIKDKNGNELYFEYTFGDWYKQEFDAKNNLIYYEDSKGYWYKEEFDAKNNLIYYEDSTGYWGKHEYDAKNNKIYYKNSDGFWYKKEYDAKNNLIYFENSDGGIEDNRPKSTKLKELNEAVVRKLIRKAIKEEMTSSIQRFKVGNRVIINSRSSKYNGKSGVVIRVFSNFVQPEQVTVKLDGINIKTKVDARRLILEPIKH